ncbi:TRAP-type C4-dicarboxylate transport system substrate-binding protein [Aminobacter lissarensis]|uniref:TRAP-type C4-dicarboxylate transport system substrate-binding protein n=1 Tax=Aminobacter carboxidus TaxID=376165 RepID=A0A8E1WJI6_9HYPH|nr:TRAP transporter substrate-binding protein DctP [Aminobacter lissarensis]MBB6469108.1 TRAP-type C4-dicarboxylate transport system substrate-binding protein [Aminobacter lissarensis]
MLTRRDVLGGIGGLSVAAIAGGNSRSWAAAQVNWKGIANHRRGASWAERWPWLGSELASRSGGTFNLETSTVPELGLTGTEIPRMLRTSLMDIADIVVGYVSGELPMLEAVQLPGIFTGPADLRKVHERWIPEVLSKQEKVMGGKIYGMGDYSTSFLVSRFPVDGLDAIKGKKIRIFSASQADMLNALGAETLSLPSAEMYSALERGVIDAVVTGPDQIFGQKLNEVATHVTDLQLGDSPFYTIVSESAWSALDPEHIKLLEELKPEFTDRGWKSVEMNNKQGLDYAAQNGMTVVTPSREEWREQIKTIGRDVVVKNWAKRAGSDGVTAFNEIIAPIAGFKAE